MANFNKEYDVRKIPWDKHYRAPYSDGNPAKAKNTGILNVKCLINTQCPFVSIPKEEHTIVFNSSTLSDEMWKFFPKHVQMSLKIDKNQEGMYFKPKYVYRHNYLFYQKQLEITLNDKINNLNPFTGNSSSSQILDQISQPWKEVDTPGLSTQFVKYRNEYSFRLIPNIFEFDEEGLSEIYECNQEDLWRYDYKTFNQTSNVEDEKNDYQKSYFERYSQNGPLGKEAGGLPITTQLMANYANSSFNGKHVHWRMEKDKPLYRGADFFIHFFRQASSPNYSFDKDVKIKDEWYKSLNFGQSKIVKEGEEEEEEQLISNPLYLLNQAYYIIELGERDPDANYIIVLCQKSNPVMIRLQKVDIDTKDKNNAKNNMEAIIVSEFKDISGEDLFKQKDFRLTFRNHLGCLAIYFDSIPDKPWVVKRKDHKVKVDENSGEKFYEEEYVNMYIPNKKISIWGGNMACGLSFGYLQYNSYKTKKYKNQNRENANDPKYISKNVLASHCDFVYPPSTFTNESIEATKDNLTVYEMYPESIVPLPVFFQLPKGRPHYIKLNSTDFEITGLEKFGIPPLLNKRERKRDGLFTQDAQMFQHDTYAKNFWKTGCFFYGQPIKQSTSPQILDDGEIKLLQSSFIKLEKNSARFRKTNRGLDEELRKVEYFKVNISLGLGDHAFSLSEGLHESDNPHWLLRGCKTPVFTGFRLVSEADNTSRWESTEIDATDHVLEFDDSWMMNDFTSIDHTGTIKFLLNRELALNNTVTEDLLNLQNKTFYIDIWAGYKDENYSLIPPHEYYRLFTGLCHGGDVSYRYQDKVMTCKVHDYTKVLKDQLFFNAPFFDGVVDIKAVNEILELAGFKGYRKHDPRKLLKSMSDNEEFMGSRVNIHLDGRKFRSKPYALPSGYARLDQAFYKAQGGDSLLSQITKFCEASSKIFYFDQHGIAHYEDYLDVVQNFVFQENDPASDSIFAFTTNPDEWKGQMIFKQIAYSYATEDVRNHIKILSNTPDQTPIFYDDVNYDSVNNPDADGFIGYKKMFYQKEPVFGSEENVKKIADWYAVTMKKPMIMLSFETYGLPVRAGDFIYVNGIKLRTTSVKHTLNPVENKWWMQVECERFNAVSDFNTEFAN